jgi:hypothetical protein
MKFDTSIEAHEFIETVFPRVGARNQAVLGRAALFLALGESIPSRFKPKDSKGVTLNDEQVIGDELRDLVRAALNHRAGRSLDEAGYRQEFRRHFEYGCQRLRQIWIESDNDQARFVSALLKLTGGDLIPDGTTEATIRAIPIVEKEVKLKLLTDGPEWSMNGPGTKNSLLVISGEPGSGKSQLALDLLTQLAGQGVRFVFFDLKGELEDDQNNSQQKQNRTKFLERTGARYIRLIRQALPINPLFRDPNPRVNAQTAYEIAHLISCFAPQLGAKQIRSISAAYQRIPEPDFQSLMDELEEGGATGVDVAVIAKIAELNLFASSQNCVNPEEWLSSSIVIDLKELGNDSETKSLAVALTLNFLMKRLNRPLAVKNGVQPLKMVLFVDEAHLLLPKEGKAGLLGSLARQGRSWGFPVWLASQDADAFMTSGEHATDFPELAECGIHFSPHTLTDTQQKAILGGIVHRELKKAEAALRLQGKLSIGMARQYWRDGGK